MRRDTRAPPSRIATSGLRSPRAAIHARCCQQSQRQAMTATTAIALGAVVRDAPSSVRSASRAASARAASARRVAKRPSSSTIAAPSSRPRAPRRAPSIGGENPPSTARRAAIISASTIAIRQPTRAIRARALARARRCAIARAHAIPTAQSATSAGTVAADSFAPTATANSAALASAAHQPIAPSCCVERAHDHHHARQCSPARPRSPRSPRHSPRTRRAADAPRRAARR